MTTFPKFELDPEFYENMRKTCNNPYELGICVILEHTGMNVTTLSELTQNNIELKGGKYYLGWKSPKSSNEVIISIPKKDGGINYRSA